MLAKIVFVLPKLNLRGIKKTNMQVIYKYKININKRVSIKCNNLLIIRTVNKHSTAVDNCGLSIKHKL